MLKPVNTSADICQQLDILMAASFRRRTDMKWHLPKQNLEDNVEMIPLAQVFSVELLPLNFGAELL